MDYLTIKEVCEVLKVSRWTVADLIEAGTLKASKVGASYRVKRSDIEVMFEENVVNK